MAATNNGNNNNNNNRDGLKYREGAASLQVLLGSAQPYQLSHEINIKRFSICLSSSLHFVPGPGLISCSEGGQQYAE